MNKKRIIGIILIVIGFFLIVSGKSFTGAVIGAEEDKPDMGLELLGIVSVLIGAGLILVAGARRLRAKEDYNS